MKNKLPITVGNILILTLVMIGLYICSQYNFLLFHILVEIFSIIIAFGIFIVAWNSRHLQKNQYLLFLGIAFFFVGLLDLVHTLAYKGMMLFPNHDTPDTATQLWIIARYTESLSLLIAPFFLSRKMKPVQVISIYSLITGLLLWLLYVDIFPVCFVEGSGLTLFKIINEYIISAILVGAFFMLHANRERFSRGILHLISASIILSIGSELAFTFYISVYGISNIVGHFFKFISFYLIYKALVETGLKDPYEFLFRELTESEKKYRTLFTNMLNGFAYHKIILDGNNLPVDYIFMEVNNAFEKMTELRKQDVIEQKVTDVIPGIKNSSFDWIGEFGKVAMSGTTLHTEQYFEVTGRWYSLSAYSPEERYFAVVFEDITDRKQAELSREEYLKQRNSLMVELERSNQDLQQFANIVSHDLLEPLRTVSSFVQLLDRRYKGKLDDKADTYINFIVEGTDHMYRLLNDLLAFARLGGGQLNLQPLELRSVLNKVLKSLGKSIEKNQAEITCAHLPVVIADESQMIQLFQNLISNALKFNGRKKPSVQITAALKENEWVICVSDNGIGINPKDINRIFLIFQRLHGREEYEGTGIGLALCKKIVERHGGQIWAVSATGSGSSFYFSIPEQRGMDNNQPE
ncbi:MAG: ATP-binding protein [Desulfobulbaceae bacterium]|nr:ATP-binding protein [Desulfobulbaceae bacterium]